MHSGLVFYPGNGGIVALTFAKLEFDDNLLQRFTRSGLSDQYKIVHVVYHILLLRHDPVLEFSLCHSKLNSCYEIDRIILHLSRNTCLEKFTLCMGRFDNYKLPSSFFSLHKLTHLKLQNCEIQPQSTRFEFSMLKSLWFENVVITISTLIHLLRCCPQLKSFTLINFSESWYSKFFELFRCLPLIEHLQMDYNLLEPFPIGITLERRLPNMLVHLRVLKLDNLTFSQEDELCSVLLLVTSSPNVEKLNLEMFLDPDEAISETALNLVDLHDYSYVILDKLRKMEITNFSNKKPEMDFIKLILSKSPMLKGMRIVINDQISVNDEVKMLRDLLWIPRASIGAQIKFERS